VTERGAVTVDGCEIRWSAVGEGSPELVLVHGGAAHQAWWDPVVRALGPRQRVVTVDLSGHGDSGWRARYAMDTWAEELVAVIAAATTGRAVVVGHSFGGRIGCIAAARWPERVRALVLVDSAVPVPPDDPVPPVRPARAYRSREAAERAFRLLPPQPDPPGAVLDHVRRTSVRARDGAWTWKFDPTLFAGIVPEPVHRRLPAIRCPVAAVYGEHSDLTSPAMARALARAIGRPVPLVVVPGAHHHVLLDDPEGLAAILAWLPETRPDAAVAQGDGCRSSWAASSVSQ
jgi:pimeloyl-ACP methyl ester carboxylesterase